MVLTDSNGDGKADKSHIFISEPKIRHAPLGLAVFDNQIVLSANPGIIVYTDVNRDAKFDPKVDKREVLLTGFKNNRHVLCVEVCGDEAAGNKGKQDWFIHFVNGAFSNTASI